MSRLTDSLLAWYDCNGNVNDATANARHLTGASDTYGAGLLGQALTGGLGSDANWMTGVNWHDTPWAFAAWFKLVTISLNDVGAKLVAVIGANTIVTAELFGTGSNTATFRVTSGGDVDVFGSLTPGWHHIVVSYSELSLEPTIYVNGAAAGALPADSVTGDTGDVSLEVNAFVDVAAPVDLVGAWQRQLSASEVKVLYNGGVGVSYAQIAAPEVIPPARTFRRPDLPTDPQFRE